MQWTRALREAGAQLPCEVGLTSPRVSDAAAWSPAISIVGCGEGEARTLHRFSARATLHYLFAYRHPGKEFIQMMCPANNMSKVTELGVRSF